MKKTFSFLISDITNLKDVKLFSNKRKCYFIKKYK